MSDCRASILLLLAALAWLPAAAQPHQHDATVRHGFEDVDRWVKEFESPDRDGWQRPGTVVRVLAVDRGQRIADLGAGTGYFTRILSREVGDDGRVYAVDVEPRMLEYIRARKDLKNNVETVLATPDDPKLPAGGVDLVLVVNTWHHIDDRIAYLDKLRQTLTREGRVAIIDWREGDLPKGPPAGSKLARDAVVAELETAGWRLSTESVALPYQYFLVFLPPAGS